MGTFCLEPIELDIDMMPQLNHPLVKAFISEDCELTQYHIQCILEAIEYANKSLYA